MKMHSRGPIGRWGTLHFPVAIKLSNQMYHLHELTYGAPDMYCTQLLCQVQACTSAGLRLHCPLLCS